jgi:hypothetical protein
MLGGKGLTGTIPPSLYLMSELVELRFNGNLLQVIAGSAQHSDRLDWSNG